MKILEIISKMDIKTILIIVLLAICAGFFYNWLYTDTGNGEERKKLEKQNKEIELEKKKIQSLYILTEKKFKRDSTELVILKKEIDELKNDLAESEKKLKSSKKELEKAKKDREETRKKIEELEKNPIKRTGESLKESLKEKSIK